MKVEVTRISPISKEVHTQIFDLTEDQIKEWESPNRRKIQHIFPELTPAQREFIMTGITEEEWNELFNDENK